MRSITVPEHIQISPEAKYNFANFLNEFVFAYNKWITEEWAPAFDRLPKEFEPGKKLEIEDKDHEKMVESVNALNEKIPPGLRVQLMKYMHAVTCAKKVE